MPRPGQKYESSCFRARSAIKRHRVMSTTRQDFNSLLAVLLISTFFAGFKFFVDAESFSKSLSSSGKPTEVGVGREGEKF